MTTQEFNESINQLENEILALFPSFKFAHSGASSVNDIVTSGFYEFSYNQSALNNTTYIHNLGSEFIHFTSLKNLHNILNENAFRLYNLQHKNDPKEFNYLIEKHALDVSKNQIEKFKAAMHIFSACQYNNNEKQHFNLWRNYGDNGNGVGVVFELFNKDWYYFLLGKTQYEMCKLTEEKLCQLVNISVKYKHLDSLSAIIGSLLLLHKSEIWKDEMEVRLLSYLNYNKHTLDCDSSLMSVDEKYISFFTDHNRLGSYITLPFDFPEINGKCIFPCIKIKKIIAGYNMGDQQYTNLQKIIFRYNKINKKEIILQPSVLRTFFK